MIRCQCGKPIGLQYINCPYCGAMNTRCGELDDKELIMPEEEKTDLENEESSVDDKNIKKVADLIDDAGADDKLKVVKDNAGVIVD